MFEKVKSSVCSGLLCCAAVLYALPLQAQDGDDSIIELSPFVVDASGDVGYSASNAISGTSLNTAIKDLPMTLEVLTKDMLNDIGATGFADSLAYSAGVFTESFEAPRGTGGPDANRGVQSSERSVSASSGGRFVNNVTIRGFDVPFQNRMGFRYGGLIVVTDGAIALGGIVDNVNVDRMEIVKGPNSLLYGVGVISGIVNMIPTRPKQEASKAIQLSVGTDNYYRGQFDMSQPIHVGENHRTYARFAGAYQEGDGRADWTNTQKRYATLQLDYYFKDDINIFAEYQYGKTHMTGIGNQWFYDSLPSANNGEFRNVYDEQFNLAREPGLIYGLGRVAPDGNNIIHVELDDEKRVLQGGGLPDTYNTSGPDTYATREEHHFMLNLEYTPTRNFALSGGVYYNTQETEEFEVNTRVENNLIPGVATTLYQLYLSTRDGQPRQPDLFNSIYGYRPLGNINEVVQINEEDDLKAMRYYWTYDPQSSDSFQARLRANYNFDTDFLGGENHSFLVGGNIIRDEADFTIGTENVGRVYNDEFPGSDALHFRDMMDFSPIRYQGEKVAMKGREYLTQKVGFDGLFAMYQGKFWRDRIEILGGMRYDRYNSETARYARVPVAGVNVPDGYSGPTITPAQLETGIWGAEAGYVENPYSQIYGRSVYEKSFPEDITATSGMFGANFDITDTLTVYGLYSEGLAPNTGLKDGRNDVIPAETTTAKEVGIKWDLMEGKLSGSFAVYEIKRHNAIWNFNAAPAPNKWADAEDYRPDTWTGNTGAEFDPTPTNDYVMTYGVDVGGVNDSGMLRPEDRETVPWLDDTQWVLAKNENFVDDPNVHMVYRHVSDSPRNATYYPAYGLYAIEDLENGFNRERRTIYWIDYNQIDQGGLRPLLERAFAAREISRDLPGGFDPIRYARAPSFSGENTNGNNPSASRSVGAFVTFDDVATGYDMEMIWRPISNLQFRFTFAHTKRSAEGAFNMVNYEDLTTGQIYAGTEYDLPVRIFGREAMGIEEIDTDGDGVADQFLDKNGNEISQDNPLLPSEAVGGIDGLSLFYNSENTASMLVRYDFIDGFLENLGVSFGAIYKGPAQTSIPIGGNDLSSNLFRTPDTAERIQFNMGFYYKFSAWDMDWKLQLNVYNLLDDTSETVTVDYVDPTGNLGTVTMRTESFYEPRSFRLSVSVLF